MEEDFYIDENWLASYCEKDWFDHICAQEIECSHLFEFPAFSFKWLYPSFILIVSRHFPRLRRVMIVYTLCRCSMPEMKISAKPI